MNKQITTNQNNSYAAFEQRAVEYFAKLQKHVNEKTYVQRLTNDINDWKENHVQPQSKLTMFFRPKNNSKDNNKYIKWLDSKGKLDTYLDRSISYIYMRDLGKDLASSETKEQINRSVVRLKKSLLETAEKSKNGENESFNMAGLYRWAEKEGVEVAVIWCVNKVQTVSKRIPAEMDAEQAQRKLIKIILGVVMHVLEEMDEKLPKKERTKKIEKAIRLGYSYGLTYPFIDDLLDSHVLNEEEKMRYTELIRTTLTTGIVPELDEWSGKNAELIRYIHAELKEAFEYIKNNQRPETVDTFFEQAYLFFHSQEVDRKKDLQHASYSNEEIYIPVILKAASSRLIVRSVISADEDKGYDDRTFYYGIYNQLADDFADMFDDLAIGAVTPYTYYWKYRNERDDLVNPFELYWAVISYLLHDVYKSEKMVQEVILDRAINGLKRYKVRVGNDEYEEIMSVFTAEFTEFNHLVQELVKKADDVDFLDKLLRDEMLSNMRAERKERDDFSETVESVREKINEVLSIEKKDETFETITEAANYSLTGDGKRLRPILAWMMGVYAYGLNERQLFPLLKSLEYMHTASLIFDDLPAQDNAAIRRGKKTVHEVYNEATAEITGLYLMQKGFEEQASLEYFDAKDVLRLIRYTAQTAMEMCKGQLMDLESKGKIMTVEELKKMCFYKTGIAFEASLLMPAIVAKVSNEELEKLRDFSRHIGIAFQIKDDLLDVEGEQEILGKPIGQDEENNRATFVSILGEEEAKKEMWKQYCLAIDAIKEIPHNVSFLKHMLNYVIFRER